MQPKAIIFDVDGTLADTEQWGHLPACNEAFQQLGLNLHWTWEEFRPMIREIPGNANRLRHALTTTFPELREQHEELVEKFTKLKQKLYNEKYASKVRLRAGVETLIAACLEAGLKIAIVSTTHESQIHKLLDSKLSKYRNQFNPILGKESGQKTGLDGILYKKCLNIMALEAEECLVIEDSEGGFLAAKKFGIPTAVFYNDYTEHEDFTGAILCKPSIESINIPDLVTGKYSTLNNVIK